eukprot:1449669-Amphidinium_carterae.1
MNIVGLDLFSNGLIRACKRRHHVFRIWCGMGSEALRTQMLLREVIGMTPPVRLRMASADCCPQPLHEGQPATPGLPPHPIV